MGKDLYVLGINYRPVEGNDVGHHPAAALLRNGAPVAMCEEERPFAPSMLAEAAGDYLEGAFPAPFMIVTFPVRPERVAEIGGVTHCDGTTRPQMVTREANPRYYDMIASFAERTGVPMVLNTSFNLKGEPMVNTPRDALRTFFSSGLDLLIMNDVLVRKQGC